MSQTHEPRQSAAERRKALSPELREVLHMLRSLEAEFGTRQAQSR
jgi:predicted trehalose synthase